MQLTLALTAPPKETTPLDPALDMKSLPDSKLGKLCFIPEGGWPATENVAMRVKQWMEANEEARKRNRHHFIQEFKAQGSAQSWFASWNPTCKGLEALSEVMEEALHVVELTYPPILERGLKHSEDMGILQSNQRGKSEGIRVKQEVYGQLILLQICCVTGPTNFDPSDGSIEFEPGAKSHILMLAYESLPSQKDLEADICTYPLIKDPSNYYQNKHGKTLTYHSEGFNSARLATQGVKVHRPWNTLSPQEQEALKTLVLK